MVEPPFDGARFVTEARLSDRLDALRHEDAEARRELAADLSQSLLRLAAAPDLARLAVDVVKLQGVVESHEKLVRRVEGGITVIKLFTGTSVIALVVALVGLWKALT